jgi:hypothetical protein
MAKHSKREAKRELILNRANEASRGTSAKEVFRGNVGRSSAADRPRRVTTKGKKG